MLTQEYDVILYLNQNFQYDDKTKMFTGEQLSRQIELKLFAVKSLAKQGSMPASLSGVILEQICNKIKDDTIRVPVLLEWVQQNTEVNAEAEPRSDLAILR